MINIERDAKIFKALFYLLMVFIDNGLGCSTFFFRFYSNSCAMLVGPANVYHVLLLEAQVPYENVSRQICARQVADVQWAVGIRQSRSNGVAFKFIKL